MTVDPVELLERAAILEADANKPRAVAEAEARAQTPPRRADRCRCATCQKAGRATVLG